MVSDAPAKGAGLHSPCVFESRSLRQIRAVMPDGSGTGLENRGQLIAVGIDTSAARH